MALSFPLSAAVFADILKVEQVKFDLVWSQEMSGTGGGETLYADLAPARWKADITTAQLPHGDAAAVMAKINSLSGGLKTFFLYDPREKYPTSDPTGTTFGSATPGVGTISDRNTLAFTGFPANYVLKAGDFFQITFGSTRAYLGQFVEDKTASGTGAVSAVSIAPALPASVAAGNPVTVIRPSGKFRMVPNSAYHSSSGPLHSRITFSAEQTYSA